MDTEGGWSLNIYYMTPQPMRDGESWGESINRHCAIVPNPDDWICLIEADVMMFPGDWSEEVEWAINAHPEIDLFTAYATRTRRKSEAMYDVRRMNERDLVKLYEEAMECWTLNRGKIKMRQHSPSGFFYLFRRRLIDEIPVPRRGKNGELYLNMDIRWAKLLRAAEKKIALIEGLCCVHYYRLHDPEKSDAHLR